MRHVVLLPLCLAVLSPRGGLAEPPRPERPAWPELTPEARTLLGSSPEDVLDKEPCTGTGLAASTTCRDAAIHLRTNEHYHQVYLPYIRDRGGAYLGVGSDQGLTFMAAARSQIGFMIDYDPIVVDVNRIHRALILHSETPDLFVARYQEAGQAEAIRILEAVFQNTPSERKRLIRIFRLVRRVMASHWRWIQAIKKDRDFHWLHSEARYRHVRGMFRQDRIRIMKGDLLKARALTGIASVCRALKIPVRVVYLSNAEEYWKYPPQFRANMTALPFDAKTIILRTRSPHKGSALGRYQYIVEDGLDFQQRLKDPRTHGVWSILRDMQQVETGVFTVGVPLNNP